MPSNHLVLCCPRVLLPSIFHIIRVFSSELAVCIRWPMYWSFSFSISPCNEYSGIKHLRVSAQKGSEGWLHVARILQAGSAQCQEGNSTRKSFFCQLVRVGCVIGFQSLLGHCMKGQPLPWVPAGRGPHQASGGLWVEETSEGASAG